MEKPPKGVTSLSAYDFKKESPSMKEYDALSSSAYAIYGKEKEQAYKEYKESVDQVLLNYQEKVEQENERYQEELKLLEGLWGD